MADGRVLVIEHSTDLGRLFQNMLEDSGIHTDLELRPPDLPDMVRRYAPAVLVLDLPQDPHQALVTLDRLRADDDTRVVPVIVLTASDRLAESALTSSNVRSVFLKPFDLEDFVEAVREAANYPTMQARIPEPAEPPSDFMAFAERALAWRSRDILFRWIQRLRHESPWRDRDDLDLAALIDHTPVMLDILDVRLHYPHPREFFARHPEALERARNHAVLRQRQGIHIGDAMREYAVLREEIWRMIRSTAPEAIAPAEFFHVEQAINSTLDAIVTATAYAYIGMEWLPNRDASVPVA